MVGDTTSQLADVVGLIFSAHLLMLNDDAFTGAMRRLVEAGRSPEAGVKEVVAHYAALFETMSETRFAEKAHDVRDLGYRLLRNLSGSSEAGDYQGRIVLAGHVYPSDLVQAGGPARRGSGPPRGGGNGPRGDPGAVPFAAGAHHPRPEHPRHPGRDFPAAGRHRRGVCT